MATGPHQDRRASLPLASATAGGRRAAPGGMPAPSRERQASTSAGDELDPPYHLLLLDDDQHSYAYVVEMLGAVLGYGPEKAYVLARIVDTEGRVIIETGPHDRVTEHQRQIHSYGADPRIATSLGSMSAVVEPAPA
ncbi:MAG: ATP-dependent Clp protease adaptor ClpS [Chloroflexi bacterium]|nr:ATP-dependent Clp protease adaptor ClpS [Chloroflexota bacterium]